MGTTRVYLEQGAKCVFAVALDWPGWARRARTGDLALRALADYQDRYALVPTIPFRPDAFEVVATLPGTVTTDFGAPDARGPWDDVDFTDLERERAVGLLRDCWHYFDRVVAASPPVLRKGPRGGGRDRDAVVEHVREAERAYCARAGTRVAPRTPWAEQRPVVEATLLPRENPGKWPARYALRRVAWHIVDHAWEIEDRRAPN